MADPRTTLVSIVDELQDRIKATPDDVNLPPLLEKAKEELAAFDAAAKAAAADEATAAAEKAAADKAAEEKAAADKAAEEKAAAEKAAADAAAATAAQTPRATVSAGGVARRTDAAPEMQAGPPGGVKADFDPGKLRPGSRPTPN